MRDAKIPYPSRGLSRKTCVTAPTSFPSGKMGLPLVPWTMPPVRFIRFSSVTRITMHFPSELPKRSILDISTENFSVFVPSIFARIYASPVWTSPSSAISAVSKPKLLFCSLPYIPLGSFAKTSPEQLSVKEERLPRRAQPTLSHFPLYLRFSF